VHSQHYKIETAPNNTKLPFQHIDIARKPQKNETQQTLRTLSKQISHYLDSLTDGGSLAEAKMENHDTDNIPT
jgi:recombinational DNA repair protein (RecF pathway)